MLTEKSIFAYRKQYPEDLCFFLEPGCLVLIKDSENHSYVSTVEETDEVFFNRLERSKNQKKNLFYSEWSSFNRAPANLIY